MVTPLKKIKTTLTKKIGVKTPVQKKAAPVKKTSISQEQFAEFVKTRAYFLWEEQGKPENQDHALWVLAEKEISGKYRIA